MGLKKGRAPKPVIFGHAIQMASKYDMQQQRQQLYFHDYGGILQ